MENSKEKSVSDSAGTPEVLALQATQHEAKKALSSGADYNMEGDLATLSEVDEEALLDPATPGFSDSLKDATEQLEGLKVKPKNLTTAERRQALKAKLEARGIKWDPSKWKRGQGRKRPKAEAPANSGGSSQTGNPLKRSRGDSATPPSAEKPVKKARGVGGQAHPASDNSIAGRGTSFRDTLAGVKIAIVPEAFPEVKLKAEQGEQVEEGLMDSFQPMEDGSYPSFLGTYIEKGALIVSCFNDATARWLVSIMEGFRPLGEELKLRAGPRKEILKATKVFFRAPPKLKSPDRILDMLDKQNPTLKAKEWSVLQSRPDPKGHTFVFLVDDTCLAAIKAANGRAFVGLWQVALTIMTGDGNRGSAGQPTGRDPKVPVTSMEVVAEQKAEGPTDQPTPQ